MILRLAVALGALLDLALARFVPDVGPGTFFRLAAATIVVLLPGGLVAEALGRRSASATLAWALAVLTGALALTFALGRSLTFTLVVLAAISLGALVIGRRRPRPRRVAGSALVFGTGVLLGIALWHVAGNVGGDGLFHLARVRKLAAFDELSLGAVNEFADGGLHPGYAFPLWHGFLALVARLSGLDPETVMLHEASVLVPLALLVAYEAGAALFRSAWLGGAVAAAQGALIALAPGYGGAYVSLAQPGTASRQLLVPASLALVFACLHGSSLSLLVSAAAAGLVLTLVHPTYALFLAVPLAGMVVVRALLHPREALRGALGLVAFLLPTGAVLLWLLPLVRETASYTPAGDELARALRLYGAELDVLGDGAYRLAPELISRSGSVAVAGLVLVPLAALAARRSWSAYVLGGSLAVLALTLVPELFGRLSDAVSLSQSRRLAGFLPFAFAVAGGAAVLARILGVLVLPLALAAGIALQVVEPGDFLPRIGGGGGPALAVWIAALGGGVAVVAAAIPLRRLELDRRDALPLLAALLFVAPVGVHAARTWSPSEARPPSPLTPALLAALREQVPERAVIFSDLETSYRLAASAPVYVAAASPAHVADNERNRPYERREDVVRFLRTGDLGIPRRYGAGWLVVDRAREFVRPALRPVFSDDRYTLYRL